MIFTTVLLLFSSVILVYVYFKYAFNYWKRRNVPFVPNPMPIFGSLYPVFTLKRQMSQWFQDQYQSFKCDYFGIYALSRPVLIVKSPKLLKDILVKDFSVFDNRCPTTSKHDQMVAGMLFIKRNPSWKRIRTKVTPVFTPLKVKQMFPLIQEETGKMLKYIKTMDSNTRFEMKSFCSKFTINLIAKCAFGADTNCFENEQAEFWIAGNEIFRKGIDVRLRFFALRFLPLLVKLFDIRLFSKKTSNLLNSLFIGVMNERKKLTETNPDLIRMLIELKDKHVDDKDFADSSLCGIALNYFAAGFETTSSVSTFTFYELCIAPDIQDKVRDEILSVMKKHDNQLTYDCINEMPYLDMVVSETLRKYPTLPFLDRECNRDYKVKDSDFVIEKGTAIYISLLGLHYDEKYFPNPQKFDPERFRNKDEINKDGLYYLPFGEGPRNCIGARFGLVSIKLVVATIISKFQLHRIPETPVPITFDIKSVAPISIVGIPMGLTPL